MTLPHLQYQPVQWSGAYVLALPSGVMKADTDILPSYIYYDGNFQLVVFRSHLKYDYAYML